MKKNKNYIYISMCLFIINSSIFGMNTYNLTKKALQQVVNGDNASALKSYVQAANEGSFDACKILAYNYGQEALLDAKDASKAEHFEQEAEKIKQASNHTLYSNYLVDGEIQKLKSLKIAQTDSLHKQILDVINDPSESMYYFKQYPLPEDAVISLFHTIKDNDKDSPEKSLTKMQLLNQALISMKSEKATKKIFESLNNSHRSNFSFSRNKELNANLCQSMLQTLTTVSLELGLTTELTKSYGTYSSQLYSNYHNYNTQRDSIIQIMENIFPAYYSIDRSQAIEKLTYYLDFYTEHSSENCDHFLKLLAILPHDELELYVQKNSESEYFLQNVIEILCKKPDLAQKFTGTSIDVDTLAIKLLRSNLDEQSTASLTQFFEHGGPQFLHKYCDDIITILPHYLQISSYQYRYIIPMITQRDLPRLQNAAITALVECNDSSNYWQTAITANLFENSTNLHENEKITLYQIMNSTYQRDNRIECLQSLWLHLKDKKNHKKLLYDSVAQYFLYNLAISQDGYCTYLNDDFPTFFNKILKHAQTERTIPHEKFLETLKIAHETKLASIIDPAILIQEKDSVIFDDNASFEQRKTFLDQRLLVAQSSEILNLFQKINDTVADEDFKNYVRNIFITIQSGSSSFKICKAKKALQDLHEKYNLPKSMPEMVARCAGGDLPNYTYNCYNQEICNNRISLDTDLTKVSIDSDGLIFALAPNHGDYQHHSLWAIDYTSLDGVWQIPVKDSRNFFKAIAGDILYTIEGSSVTSYNKYTGAQIKKCTLVNTSPVTFFATDTAGILYIVQDRTTITAIDPITGDAIFTENEIWARDCFTTGQTFGYYNGKEIVLHTKAEPQYSISLHNDDDFFDPIIFSNKNSSHLLYTDNDQDQLQLIAFNIDTHSEKWRFPLEKKIKGKPCMSQDETKIFIFTQDAQIIALKNNGESVESLWNIKTPITFTWGSAELALSPDGKTLFCLQVNYGDLYTFDALNGDLIATTKCEEGRDRHLLSVSHNGLPYIQGKHY